MTTRRMIIMLVLVAVVFGGVFGMQAMSRKGMTQYFDNMPVPPANITTALATEETWTSELEAPGTVTPVNGTEVSTEIGGIVTALHFESGQRVAKGAPLIELDAANERAELARLQAQAELADLNRDRRQKLFALEAISRSDLDVAVSEAKAAHAAVEAQRAKLANKNIRAPFAGVLGIRKVSLGDFLSPGQAIVTVQALDPINVDFDLPEQHLGKVTPGFKVQVLTESYGDRVFDGVVEAIEPQVDAATRNFKVRARLANADGALRPGQFGRVQVALPGQRHVVVIPRTALDFSAYGTAVFVVVPRKASAANSASASPGTPPAVQFEVAQRFVKTGTVRGDFVAVESGLKPGEQVATAGLLKLSNGHPVIVNNENVPKPETAPQPEQG